MEITYVYDPEVETYRRIVEEHETSYLISNILLTNLKIQT